MAKKKVKIKVVFVHDTAAGCEKCCFAGSVIACMIENGHHDCTVGHGGYWRIHKVEAPCQN